MSGGKPKRGDRGGLVAELARGRIEGVAVGALFGRLLDCVRPDRFPAHRAVMNQPGVHEIKKDSAEHQQNHVHVGREKQIGRTADGKDEYPAGFLVMRSFILHGFPVEPEHIDQENG